MAWSRIRQWSRLFSEYAVAQGLTQLFGLAAGLWLVHLLPVREYALYALALSIFTFLTVFSDLGVSSALLYFRRESRTAQTAFAPYVRAAFGMRRGLLIAGALAGLAFMTYMGREREFRTAEIAAAGAVLVGSVWFQVNASMALQLIRLEGMYRQSYFAEVLGNAVRLIFVAALWVVSLPLAWLALLTGALGTFATSVAAARALPGPDSKAPPEIASSDRNAFEAIFRYILPTTPSAAYFAMQAPLMVWLSAFFAGTESIAEVGALGRLGVIFGLLSGFMGTVLMPRLSVVVDDTLFLRRYFQIWVALAGFGAGVVAVAWRVPEWLLLLLGDSYRGLTSELLLVAITSVLTTWGGFAVAVNNARGWVRVQPIALAAFALVQAWLVASIDLSTTDGVLFFGVFSSLTGLILQVAINAAGFVDPKWLAVSK